MARRHDAEQRVRAGAVQRDVGDLPAGPEEQEGRQAGRVRERKVDAGGAVVECSRVLCQAVGEGVVTDADMCGNPGRDRPLIEAALVEAEGECVDGVGGNPCRDRANQAGVDTAAQEDTGGTAAIQPACDAVVKGAIERVDCGVERREGLDLPRRAAPSRGHRHVARHYVGKRPLRSGRLGLELDRDHGAGDNFDRLRFVGGRHIGAAAARRRDRGQLRGCRVRGRALRRSG